MFQFFNTYATFVINFHFSYEFLADLTHPDKKLNYTLSRNSSYTPSAILLQRGFDREPLKLHKQMIPHLLALDVGVKICQAQLCSFIRGCHATFLVKNTLFKEEVAWQPLKELQSCSSSILEAPTRAFKWSIVCLFTITTFEEISDYVKKCLFLLYKINIFWHNHLFLQKLW